VALPFLSATAANAQTLTLAWDPPTDDEAAGYVLWYGTAPKTYTKSIDVGLTLSYTVQNLLPGTGYCFAVRAYDEDRTMSDLSSEVCGNTLGTPPPPVDDGSDVDPLPVGSKEIVLYASKGTPRGNWVSSTSTGAADGRSMRSADKAWTAANAPLASPTNYFDLQFDAAAATPYRVWLRLRAAGDSKWNDAVWVQFSGALVNGRTAYQIGTTSGLLVNLERCSACGLRGWGWMNSAYWLVQTSVVTFAKAGPQTMRIQIREDGVEIDQVVLSAARFFSSPPGPPTGDATILAPTATATSPPPTSPTLTTPYSGTPVAIPGVIEAARFDNGAAGAAFFDSTAGNTGGVFRNTDVDLQRASDGGYNVAWTTAGEWLLYTTNVTRAATYYAYLHVASTSTGAIELSAGAPSNTTKIISVPNTGGWQTWTLVRVPITLAAGVQTIKVRVTSGSPNLRKIEIR
jgi:hypothetical protein